MPLLLGGKPFTDYVDAVKDHPFFPKGKIKDVTFLHINPVPFRVKTENGWQDRPINMYMYKLRYMFKNPKTGAREELRYYETAIPEKDNTKYVPNSLDMMKGIISFNAEEKPDLFFFFMNDPDNSSNTLYDKESADGKKALVNRLGKPFTIYQSVLIIDSKKNMEKFDLIDDAKAQLRLLAKDNTDLMGRLAIGLKTLSVEAVEDMESAGNYDGIRESLYKLVEADPIRFMAAYKDGRMDMRTRIQKAIQSEIIKSVGDEWLWGVVHEDKPVKRLVKIPAAYQGTAEDFILEYLSTNKAGLKLVPMIDRELDAAEQELARS